MKTPSVKVSRQRSVRLEAILAVAVLLLASGVLAGWASVGAKEAPGPATGPAAPGAHAVGLTAASARSVPSAERIHALESGLRSRGVPARYVHPPDLTAAEPGWLGQVQPTYDTGPAPMGISDLGLRNASGVLVPYDYNSSSVWGSVTLDRAQSAYVDGDGPDTFGLQLNAVATNVTLQGFGGYEFWTQEFVSYTSSTENLSFGDNVWNFSSPAGAMPSNVFASHGPNGTLVSPYYYYAVGPSFTVTYPFTVELFLNSSMIDGLPAVYFNYSVTATSGTLGGSFDHVVFNASSGIPHGLPPPAPAFQVNGTGLNPFGLPNDFELVLVGDGNGDTTTFFAINATMALRYWNATADAYENVPAAFDAGSDTGETSNGLLPVYHAATVEGGTIVSVVTGPSFVQGLWNVSYALDGARTFVVAQHPQNAFLFVSPGTTFNASFAQWVPTIHRFGATRSIFSVPNDQSEVFEWMLSDHDPIAVPVTASSPAANTTNALNETLGANATMGSYTPLLAWGNGELGAISQSGNGTSGNPYILIHHPVGALEPVFGQLNDFAYPVFAGVLLINTTDYVDVVQPALAVGYGAWQGTLLTDLGLPSSNTLQLEFWNVSDLVVLNSTDLSGWLPSSFTFYPAGELVLWGSSGNLISRSTFHDQGVGIALYGGTDNTVWGNTFFQASVEPSFQDGTNTTGILEAESGDLLYNNYVSVPQPALTPTSDPVSCENVCLPAMYVDAWNVPEEPSNASTTVLGLVLTGSIVRTPYQGGNYWSNYGTASDPFGILPYNDHGLIASGGDYVPLVISALYTVTFSETGLAGGVPWNVTAIGVTTASTSTDLVVELPNGSYAYALGTPAGYAAAAGGAFVVQGANLSVPIVFEELFPETVTETGLVAGWNWTVGFVSTTEPEAPGASATRNSTGGQATVELVNGTYRYTVSAQGYTATPAAGAVTIDGGPADLAVQFTLSPILTVTASGLAPGTPWTVTVRQGSASVNLTGVGDGSLVFTMLEVNPGGFAWKVAAANYTATPSAGTATAPGPVTVRVAFLAKSVPSSGPGVDWAVVALGALAALAILGFVLFAVERRRRRTPRAPVAPAAAVEAPAEGLAAPPGGSAPWEESSTAAPPPSASPPWEEGPGDVERSPSSPRRP